MKFYFVLYIALCYLLILVFLDITANNNAIYEFWYAEIVNMYVFNARQPLIVQVELIDAMLFTI